jgi:hypothetical protein
VIRHDVLFPLGYPLISRIYFSDPGVWAAEAPPLTAWVRAAASGAGGFKDDADGWGGGAAFAFSSESCAPGADFQIQVGDTQHSRPAANDALGNTWVKRADSSILVLADRGRPDGSPGLGANSTGLITRSGGAAGPSSGGASAGDDSDPFPLGFGGVGASITNAPWYGGGGGRVSGAFTYPQFAAADGRACLEFYAVDPGYE